MAMTKSFKTYTPTEGSSFDINGQVFHLNPVVPGDVLLDFLEGAEGEDTAKMAKVIRDLMQAAIVPQEYESWKAFIRNPANNVTLSMLAEIAGYVTERLSGNPTDAPSMPFMTG